MSGSSVSATANSATAFTLGQSGTGDNSLLGALAEVAFWNRVLNADERKAIGAGRYCPDFVRPGLLYYAPLMATINSTIGPQPTGSTGITFTDHSPVIRRSFHSMVAPQAHTAAASTIAQRRTSTELGTRTGSRQAVEN